VGARRETEPFVIVNACDVPPTLISELVAEVPGFKLQHLTRHYADGTTEPAYRLPAWVVDLYGATAPATSL
jgi:hypothetical protein